MQYGKLINGQIVPAPNPLHVNRGMVYNPSGYIYESVGYHPIVDTPMPEPEDGTEVYYASHWEEQDGQIVRVWAETDPPEPEPEPDPAPTTDERVVALEAENKTLKAQVSAQSEQMDFYEECIAEMASVVYA